MFDFDFDLSQVNLGESADIDGFLSGGSTVAGEQNVGGAPDNPILQSLGVQNTPSYDLANIHAGASGIDSLFEREPQMVSAAKHGRRVVASMKDLASFTRVSAETLVHKSEQDLWGLAKEADGKFYIQRLFDDNGTPLKG
jgi:hypothetical protein